MIYKIKGQKNELVCVCTHTSGQTRIAVPEKLFASAYRMLIVAYLGYNVKRAFGNFIAFVPKALFLFRFEPVLFTFQLNSSAVRTSFLLLGLPPRPLLKCAAERVSR